MALLPMPSTYLCYTYAIFKIQYNTMRVIVGDIHTKKQHQYTQSLHIYSWFHKATANINSMKCCYFLLHIEMGGAETKESALSFRHASNYKLHLQTVKCDTNESLFDCLVFSVIDTRSGYEQRQCFIISSEQGANKKWS